MSTIEDVCIFFLTQFPAMRNVDVAASFSPVPIHIKSRGKKTERGSKKKSAYIICVDVPCHVSIRHKLSVNVASDFTVPPAAVDVNYTDHVPLRVRRESD